MPMRGPATVIARMMRALITPPSSCHFGPATASPTPTSERRASRSTPRASGGSDRATRSRPPRCSRRGRRAVPELRSERPRRALPRRRARRRRRSSSRARTLYAPRTSTERGADMVRAIILLRVRARPGALRAAHRRVRSKRRVQRRSGTGRSFGSPFGEPRFQHYAEFEWEDMEAFKAAASSEFAAAGRGRDGDGHPVHRALRRRSSDASRRIRVRATRPSSASRRSSTRRRRRARRSG